MAIYMQLVEPYVYHFVPGFLDFTFRSRDSPKILTKGSFPIGRPVLQCFLNNSISFIVLENGL